MKKRIAGILLALCLVVSCSVSAFAASGFNSSVMKQGQNVVTSGDDMEGYSYYELSDGEVYEYFYFPTETWVTYMPIVVSSDTVDSFAITFNMADYDYESSIYSDYYADSSYYSDYYYTWREDHFFSLPEQVIFKVGNTRYVFSNLDVDMEYDYGFFQTSYVEDFTIWLDGNSCKMMEDMIAHRNDTVRVRIKGALYDYDFELDQDTIDKFIHLYNLYVQAGGTRSDNLSKISSTGQYTTCKIYG